MAMTATNGTGKCENSGPDPEAGQRGGNMDTAPAVTMNQASPIRFRSFLRVDRLSESFYYQRCAKFGWNVLARLCHKALSARSLRQCPNASGHLKPFFAQLHLHFLAD